jgi:hypothetical protein
VKSWLPDEAECRGWQGGGQRKSKSKSKVESESEVRKGSGDCHCEEREAANLVPAVKRLLSHCSYAWLAGVCDFDCGAQLSI